VVERVYSRRMDSHKRHEFDKDREAWALLFRKGEQAKALESMGRLEELAAGEPTLQRELDELRRSTKK